MGDKAYWRGYREMKRLAYEYANARRALAYIERVGVQNITV